MIKNIDEVLKKIESNKILLEEAKSLEEIVMIYDESVSIVNACTQLLCDEKNNVKKLKQQANSKYKLVDF